MPDFKELFNKYKEKWDGFEKSQKIRLILSVVIVLGSVAVATFLVTRPNYQKLVSGSTSEIGEMSAKLTENAITHKLSDGGTVIMVKAKDKDNAQIALSQSGFLDDSTKLEDAINLISFTTTESDKKKIYKDYYEKKIASKLTKMENVEEAVVNLSIPDKSIFSTDDSDAPMASVMIKPKGTLTETQLSGIASLVAASIEGLKSANVTIVDNTGAVLNDKSEVSTLTGLSTTNMQIQAEKKKEIENQVKSLLSDVSDSVKVMAEVICDFDQEVTSSVTYSSPLDDSDTGILRSQQITKSSSSSTNGGTIVGADSNQGAGALDGVTGTSSSESAQSITSEYEINQVNKDIVKGLGNLDPTRSSITVNLLYGNKFTESPIATDEARDTIVKMVNTATGIDADRITVTSFKMAVADENSGFSFNILILLETFAPYMGVAVILIIVMIFVLKIKSSFTAETEFGDIPLKGANIDYAVYEDETVKELDNNSEVKKQINSFIDKQPDIAAGMLRNWLYENDK